MTPCAWFPEAVKMLNANPGLDVGVHVVLTSEWENIKWRPLTKAASLVDADGYFYPTIWRRKDAPASTSLRDAKWNIQEIEAEMRAQIELAIRKIPRLSHMTGHMGSGSWDPKVKALWTKLAREYKLDISAPGDGVQRFAGYRGAKTIQERTGKFIKSLEAMKSGTYLFVEHPGLDTAEMQAISHKGYENVAKDRDAVTELFVNDKVKKKIKDLNIKLISYADLKNIRMMKMLTPRD
jgi:hypothetical protein